MQLIADDVWTSLAEYLTPGVARRAAIAYVGADAVEMLSLGAGDSIIIDGSDAVVSSGGVDPDAIAQWLDATVDVRSLPGLHAKVLLIEDDPAVAVVGSANASRHSRENLFEAVILTDDNEVCEQLRQQMDVWWTRSDAIDQRWLTRAWRIYRPATPRTGRRRPGTRPTTDQPLWLGTYIDDDSTLAPQARAERDRLIARHGEGAVETWKMHRGDDKTVRPGHEVVLINAANREDPHGNAKAWPPATVARVLEGSKSQPPIALLVWTDDTYDHQRDVRFGHVRQALRDAGASVRWDEFYASGSAAANAVRALWSVTPKTY